MKALKPKAGFNAASALAAGILLLLYPVQEIYAQQQASAFSISGWAPGSTPIFGSGSNLVNLSYGDSLTTVVSFSGNPNDGLGTDHDNVAYVNFSYSYTTYLTRFGDSFSVSSSIPLGTHTVSAYQSCSSGTVPPWMLAYDLQPAVDTDDLDLNIADGIGDCVPPGNYEVDILIDNYAQSSTGPAPQPLLLQWSAYTGVSGFATLSPPSNANTAITTLNPTASYLFRQVAYVHVDQPAAMPVLTLEMSGPVETSHKVFNATVTADYSGHCPQNPCTYLWSDGQTAATATGLTPGHYTVTVTAPCGTTAAASITIYDAETTDITDLIMHRSAPSGTDASAESLNGMTANAELSRHQERSTKEGAMPSVQVNPYPNPCMNTITFDLRACSGLTCSLRIFDLMGNEVSAPATGLKVDGQDSQLEVSLESLPAGIYLYEMVTNRKYSGKFVKQ